METFLLLSLIPAYFFGFLYGYKIGYKKGSQRIPAKVSHKHFQRTDNNTTYKSH